MSLDDHLSIAIVTGIDPDTGDPQVSLHLGQRVGDADAKFVGHVAFPPVDALLFARKMEMAALDVELVSATVMALREHKISEEEIDMILDSIDVNRQARRAR